MKDLCLSVLLILVLGLSIPSESSAQCGRVRSVVKNTSAKVIRAASSAAVSAKGVVLESKNLALSAGRNCARRVLEVRTRCPVSGVSALGSVARSQAVFGQLVKRCGVGRAGGLGGQPEQGLGSQHGTVSQVQLPWFANDQKQTKGPAVTSAPRFRSVLERPANCANGTCVK